MKKLFSNFKLILVAAVVLLTSLALLLPEEAHAVEERQVLTVYSNEYTYDGEGHTIVAEAAIEGTKLQYSTDRVTWDDEKPFITNVGSMTVYVKATKDGQTTLEGQGTVTITKRDVYIRSASDDKVYDGNPLELDDTYVYGNVAGDTITAKATGTITTPGECANTIEYQFDDTSKAKNYNVVLKEGTLTVDKISITITSKSGVKSYDGNAYSKNEITVVGEFLKSDIQEGYPKAVGTITNVGETANTIDYGWVNPENANYYDITEYLGTLYVVDSPVVFKGYTVSKVYDGLAVKPDGGIVGVSGTYSLEYSTDGGATYGKTAPQFTNAGTYEVPMRLTYGGQFYYATSTVTISKRKVTVATSSDTKPYDGTPLTNTIGCSCIKSSFVAGDLNELLSCMGSQTDVGESKNYPCISWAKGKSEDNYDITFEIGTLTVTKQTGNKFTHNGNEFTTLNVYSLYDGGTILTPKDVKNNESVMIHTYNPSTQEWTNSQSTIMKCGHSPLLTNTAKGENILKAEDDTHEATYATVNVFQVPIVLNISVLVPNSKTYDGTADTTATITEVKGVLQADTTKVSVDVDEVAYEDEKAGNNKKVNISFKLTGDKAAFYKADDITETNCKINAVNLSSVAISPIIEKAYTGSAIEPTLDIAYSGMTLVEDTDYTTEYTNNIEEGTATIAITGIGNYTGSRSVTFKIAKKNIANAAVNAINDQGYTGSAVKPEPVVKYTGRRLVKDTDYTLSYKDNVQLGTATVTITGKGLFKGTTTATFKIVEADYTVTFDMQDHGEEVTEQKVKNGELATKPNDPSENGYIFVDWFTEKAFNNKWDFSTPVTGNIILYAQWVKVDKKVTVGDTNANVDEDAIVEFLSKYSGCASKIGAEIIISQNSISNSDMSAIETANPNKYYEYYDVKFMFTEENDTFDYGSYNNTLIPITYEFDFTGKSNIKVVRVHGNVVSELTETSNADGEYVEFDKTKGKITIVAKKYSTYGFVYDKVPSTGDNSNIWLYITFLILSISAATVLTLKKKAIKK